MQHFMRDLGDLTGLDIAMAGVPPVASAGPVPEREDRSGSTFRSTVAASGVAGWLGLGTDRDARCRVGRDDGTPAPRDATLRGSLGTPVA